MGRVLLVLVIAAAALASPSVRAGVVPYVQPALDPVYEWSTHSKVSEIARMLATERASGRSVPEPRAFTGFLDKRYPGGGSVDPWGTPYYLKTERRGGTWVGSAGRDATPGTPDDIREPLAASASR
jgi:hypothetical protein